MCGAQKDRAQSTREARVRWKLLAVIVFLAVAGGAVAVSFGAFTPTTTSASGLLTATAAVADVSDEVAATGTVTSSETYGVGFGAAPWVVTDDAASTSPTEGGITWAVDSIKVHVGDLVQAGDELATADTADLDAQIADANRSAKSAELQLTQAEKDLDDAESGAPTRQARIALYNAESSKARAEADLAALKKQLDYAVLTAPIAGIVTDVALTEGADAPSGAAITVASRTLQVETSVVESDVASIALDQAATVTIGAIDQSIEGTVTSIAPSPEDAGSSGVVSFAISVELKEVPPALRAGMSADVTIVTASANDVLTIPSRALSGSGDNYSVRLVGADGSVTTRSVTVGLVTDSLAEIKSGLSAGDAVVTGTSSTQTLGNGAGNGGGGFGGGGLGGPPGGGIIRGQP
jgi:RND family efflux transporter MFP subunit